MNKYMIERKIPDIGSFEYGEYQAAAQKSNEVLEALGPEIEWIESYVTENQTYCVYMASEEKIIHKHSELSGFPANKIRKIVTDINPSTAG